MFSWCPVISVGVMWAVGTLFGKYRQKTIKGNALRGGGNAIFTDTEGALVYSPKKLVALVGVKDLIIVETKDALLICKKGRSQDVKKVVDTLEAKKKKYI